MKTTKSKPAEPPSTDHEENLPLKGSDRLLEGGNNPSEKQRANSCSSTDQLLARICDMMETRLRSAAEEREKTDADEEMKNDWMLAAAVIDRLLSIIFSFLFIGGTFVFFLAFLLLA